MKTNENIVAYVARLAGTLLIICMVVALCLAAVNSVTAPAIEKLNYEKTQKAIEAVLPGGGDEVDFTDKTGLVSAVYKGGSGYADQVAPGGFDGPITMMVGVDFEGNVLGISVIKHTETAGLGAVAAASTTAGENFRAGFVGQSGSVSVTKDGGSVEAITGATITSRAVCAGVKAALDCVGNMG